MTSTVRLNNTYKNLKILKIEDLMKVNTLVFVKKCLYKECPELFYDYYEYRNHEHFSRDRKLRIPRSRTIFGSKSLKIKGASLWNSFDKEIKQKAKLQCFKKHLTIFYTSKY